MDFGALNNAVVAEQANWVGLKGGGGAYCTERQTKYARPV